MTITFAGTLFAIIGLAVCFSVTQTLVRYGAQVLRLGRELKDCEDFIEIRVALRAPVTLRPHLVQVSSLAPARRSPVHAALRAAA